MAEREANQAAEQAAKEAEKEIAEKVERQATSSGGKGDGNEGGNMITPFVIVPYVSVGPIDFGMARTGLHALLGPPDYSRKSRYGPKIIDSWNREDLTAIFSGADGTVMEVGFGKEQSQAEVIGVKLFDRDGSTVYGDLCAADGAPKQNVGITVLFKFGLALDGFLVTEQDDRAVTAFAKGVRDESDPRLKPVKIDFVI